MAWRTGAVVWFLGLMGLASRAFAPVPPSVPAELARGEGQHLARFSVGGGGGGGSAPLGG